MSFLCERRSPSVGCVSLINNLVGFKKMSQLANSMRCGAPRLGILFSMFTAIYMSRTFFDIAERKGFVSLSMSNLINALRIYGLNLLDCSLEKSIIVIN